MEPSAQICEASVQIVTLNLKLGDERWSKLKIGFCVELVVEKGEDGGGER